MNGTTFPISLQHEDAWPLPIFGILFNYGSLGEALDEISNQDAILGEFIVSMAGHSEVPCLNQAQHALEKLTHSSHVPGRLASFSSTAHPGLVAPISSSCAARRELIDAPGLAHQIGCSQSGALGDAGVVSPAEFLGSLIDPEEANTPG